MSSILFSVNPEEVNMSDALNHLKSYGQIYFTVKFPVVISQFSFPMVGFIHISRQKKERKVRYVAEITSIVPFLPAHFEDPRLKPDPWRMEWEEKKNIKEWNRWKNSFVISKIVPFECNTLAIKKADGTPLKNPPQSYTKVLSPIRWKGF